MKNFKITSLFASIIIVAFFPYPLSSILLLIVGAVLLTYLLFRIIDMRKEINLLKEVIQYFIDSFQDIRVPVSLAHTPLTTVCGKNCPESIKSTILLVIRNIESLDGHLSRLMNLKQMFVDVEKVELAEYELGDLLRSRLCALRGYAANKHVILKLDTKFSYGSVWLDLCKVSPVIDQFVKNTIDSAKPESTITMQVSLSLDCWVIDIIDGNYEELAKCYCCKKGRIFARNTAREYVFAKSMLCKKMMQLCNGKILLDSTNCTVSLQLPVECSNGKMPERIVTSQIAACRDEEVVDAHFGEREQKRNSCKPVVALVDSNDEFRIYLKMRLSDDFIVKDFRSGAEAMAHIIKDHPDVVVCDTILHEMNGDELSSRLKTSRDTAIIPVILYGSRMDTDHRYKREASLADLFLLSPFQIEDLKIEIFVLIRNNRFLRKGFLQYVFGENFVVDGGEDGDAIIDMVKNLILENLANDKPLSVVGVFEALGMSRTSFYNKWKALTGECLSKFIYKIRIEKGRELLESGLYNINEIHGMIGMGTAKYFRDEFKKHYNMTPSEWVKKCNSVSKLKHSDLI